MSDAVLNRLSPSPEQHQRLQDVVQDILLAALENGGSRYKPLVERTDQTAAAFTAAVWSAVETVVDDYLVRLSRRDPIVYLPTELATACFRLLDGLEDRVAVSQVSRAWRQVALSDCGLWTSLQYTYARAFSHEMLEAWLARSGSLPFDFTYDSYPSVPEPLLDLIARNAHRMRFLDMRYCSERILQLDAPSLRHLRLGDELATLPATWGTRVPLLEKLELNGFSVPDDFQALPALTYLHGRLSAFSSTPALAEVFPRLVKLWLSGMSQETVQDMGAPPPFCEWMTLAYTHERQGAAPIDYSPFLERCYERRLSYLSITGADSIVPSMQEFAHSTQGKCSMYFHMDNELRLDCEHDGVTRAVQKAGGPYSVREVRAFAYFDRLHALSISMGILLDVYEIQLPGATFPALHSMTLILSADEIPMARHLLPADTTRVPLRLPRLHELTLETRNLEYRRREDPGEHMRWLLDELPTQLPELISTDRPHFGVLTVVLSFKWEVEHFNARQDLAALRGLAEEFHVVNQTTFYHFDDVYGDGGA